MNQEKARTKKEQPVTPDVKALYDEIEPKIMPIIRRKAYRYSRGGTLELEDAIQEGRLAIAQALASYDYNRAHGKIEGYVNVVLDYTYRELLHKAFSKGRMPRTAYYDNDTGNYVSVPSAPLSLNESGDWAKAEPEPDQVELDEREQLLRVFKMKMMFIIGGKSDRAISTRGQIVFQCLTNPPPDLLKTIANEGGDPTQTPGPKDIAKYMGCDKNVVDFEMWKIWRLQTELMESPEFSELFGDLVGRKGWPMIHISDNQKGHDHDFVRDIIQRRKLDPRPMPDYTTHKDYLQKMGDNWRLIERYPWGMVMVLKKGEEYRTMVIEGKVNLLGGYVLGDHQQRKSIPVSWYIPLAKKLNGAKA
jgi:hypothetical protein